MRQNGLALVLGAGLALFVGSVWCAERRRCRTAGDSLPPAELCTWEGEGGNIPEVPTPEPARGTSH